MVNPGGTGRPAFVISARPAPLPPRTSFILPLPSALPPPKEYTYFVDVGLVAVDFASAVFVSAVFVPMIPVSGRVLVAIYGSSSTIISQIPCLRSQSRKNRQSSKIL